MRIALVGLVLAAVLLAASPVFAQAKNPCNPCAKNPRNPCAKNPCNPCAKNPRNPCAKNPRNPCGKSAVTNPCLAKHGTVFTVSDPVKRDTVSFTSSAPLEDFVGASTAVTGHIAFDPENPTRGVRGTFTVPVASLDTGIPLRNEHLQSKSWLNAAAHPNIVLRIGGTQLVRLLKKGSGYRTYEMVLSGIITLNGRSKPLDIAARVTYLPESAKTRQRAAGDLLASRAEFSIRLADFGIKGMNEVVGSKVSEVIQVKVGVMGNTKPVSAAIANACNPCNPCAKKR